jgi:hypothetical protein
MCYTLLDLRFNNKLRRGQLAHEFRFILYIRHRHPHSPPADRLALEATTPSIALQLQKEQQCQVNITLILNE